MMSALFSVASVPSSHFTSSACAPLRRRPVVVGDDGDAAADLRRRAARRATAFALSALKLATLPPNTGQRTTRAMSMPGQLHVDAELAPCR